MAVNSVFIYSEDELKYRFHEHHPFNPQRIVLTVDLLKEAGALSPSDLRQPSPVPDEMLMWVHDPRYVETVKALGASKPDADARNRAAEFGLDSEDTPFFPGMHEAAACVTGGSVLAAELVMTGQARHALHLSGGLHHAMPNRGSGFCVYNDAAVAIAYLRRKYNARVLYVDTDVHHGDGVQFVFYGDPNVLTFSIHETGKYLFPGTGAVHERGDMHGFGYTVNMPVEPYTEDDSWMECFAEVLEAAVRRFRPDIIVSQHGCDAHAFDPLAHIHCSMDIYWRMPALIHQWAHDCCEGRWVALGGGGYDIYRVVPRAWALLWMNMTDHPLWNELGMNRTVPLPQRWIARWQPESPFPLPSGWLDPVQDWQPMPRRREIAEKNRKTKELAMMYLR